MPSEINGNQSTLNSGNARNNKAVGQASKSTQAQPLEEGASLSVGTTDTVSISQAGQQLQNLENEVRKEPEVRQDLVAAIRQKIADGTYQMDSRVTARNIMSQEGLL